jgi:hypothetical protein
VRNAGVFRLITPHIAAPQAPIPPFRVFRASLYGKERRSDAEFCLPFLYLLLAKMYIFLYNDVVYTDPTRQIITSRSICPACAITKHRL